MKGPFNVQGSLKTFTGHAPLFPLPDGVLFPHLVLPLHIFEERYREMTADALAGDRLIAMALLRPGWEPGYNSKSVAIYPTVCLGTIVADQKLDDGRYNILVRGLCRAQVLAEDDTDHLYRVGHLLPVKDIYPPRTPAYWRDCRRALLGAFLRRFPRLRHDAQLQRAVRDDLSLGTLCDLLCQSLSLDASDAAHALMELDVSRRCEWLLERTLQDIDEDDSIAPDGGRFPPPFSEN